jgi:DNA-binding NarL/FixJ family response regulator
MDAGPLRALIIDSQPLRVAALARLLAHSPLQAMVSTASRSDDGLQMASQHPVDLVLCDVKAHPTSGAEVAQALSGETHSVPVVLLGEGEDEELLLAALRSPAAGLFTHDVMVEEFLAGVTTVLAGHRAIGAVVMSRLIHRMDQIPQPDSGRFAGQLSPTELEILRMIGRAQSVPSIASVRGISRKTVRNHLAKIYRKLELHGRTEAMLWAARAGLTSGE